MTQTLLTTAQGRPGSRAFGGRYTFGSEPVKPLNLEKYLRENISEALGSRISDSRHDAHRWLCWGTGLGTPGRGGTCTKAQGVRKQEAEEITTP